MGVGLNLCSPNEGHLQRDPYHHLKHIRETHIILQPFKDNPRM